MIESATELAATRQEVVAMVSRANRRVEQFDRAREQIDALTVKLDSPDGQITVTVRSGGELADLWFGDRAKHIRPGELASQVLALIRRAQGELAAHVSQILSETVSRSDPASNALAEDLVKCYRERFPPQPPPERSGRSTGPRQMRVGILEETE